MMDRKTGKGYPIEKEKDILSGLGGGLSQEGEYGPKSKKLQQEYTTDQHNPSLKDHHHHKPKGVYHANTCTSPGGVGRLGQHHCLHDDGGAAAA